MKLRIGTRGSELALWQARHIAGALAARAGLECELVVLKTRGDVIDDVPLTGVEGKAFFTAEIERALLAGDVDLAVHCHKDLPTGETAGLTIAAVPQRGAQHERLLIAPAAHDPAGAFLPVRWGASVGTSAPRRAEQLKTLRPDLELRDLRGNVPTRVRKLREGLYDAILLAAAGLDRLELALDDLEVLDLPLELFVPAPAQGALAVQARAGDAHLIALCRRHLHDESTARAIQAERDLLEVAGGGCNLPLGAAIEAADANGQFRARVFLGAGHPRGTEHGRWSEAAAADPSAAARAAFDHLANGGATGTGPLSPLRIALTGSGSDGSLLSQRLTALGATVIAERVIELEPLPGVDLGLHLEKLSAGDVLAVTSRQVAFQLARHRRPAGLRVAAVGASCARELSEEGWAPDLIGRGGALELAKALAEHVQPSQRVLFPCALEAEHDLERSLAERGIEVERVEVYHTLPIQDVELSSDVDVRVYLSGLAVEAALAWERAHPETQAVRFALGRSSSLALARAGLDHVGPTEDAAEVVEDLVHRIARLRAQLQPQP
jgi:hydroxymethylbilane synthase